MTDLTYLMDVHVPRVITDGLRRRDINVTTAQEEGYRELTDTKLLEKANDRGYVVFTLDSDFLKVSHRLHDEGKPHPGVIYAHLLQVNIGECMDDLQLIAEEREPADLQNQIIFLPI